MNDDPKPWPHGWVDYGRTPHALPNFVFKKLEHEIAQHLRNKKTIDDMKRRFGVTERKD